MVSILTDRRLVVVNSSGRDGVAVIEPEEPDVYRIFYSDDTTTVPRDDVRDMYYVDAYETLESLGRTKVSVDEGTEDWNRWTSGISEAFEIEGADEFNQEYFLSNLETTISQIKEKFTNIGFEFPNLDPTMFDMEVKEQVDCCNIDVIKKCVINNEWTESCQFVIPIAIAYTYKVELWVHYKHLEEHNVLRFRRTDEEMDGFCVITCEGNNFYHTAKDKTKIKKKSGKRNVHGLAPGEELRTMDQANARIIRKIFKKKNKPKYYMEINQGGFIEPTIISGAKFKEKIDWDATRLGEYDDETLGLTNAASAFGTKQISFRPFNKTRKSILKKFDSEELLLEDCDEEEDWWEHIETMTVYSKHKALDVEIQGIYNVELHGEEWVHDDKDEGNEYIIYKHDDYKGEIVLGKRGQHPILKIDDEDLDIQYYIETKNQSGWHHNKRRKIKITYEFDSTVHKDIRDAFEFAQKQALARTSSFNTASGPADIRGRSLSNMSNSSCEFVTSEIIDESMASMPMLPDLNTFHQNESHVTETKSARKIYLNKKIYLNQYEMGGALGSGAFGEVVFGRDTKLNRKVAIKIIRRPKPARSRGKIGGRKLGGRKKKLGGRPSKNKEPELSEEAKALNREIAVMKKIVHENCVQLYEYIDDGTKEDLYLVLEYVNGGSLEEYLKQEETVHLKQARKFFIDFMKGLEYLHKHRIAHSDLKPANIMLTREGRCKLVDFGVSHWLVPDNSYICLDETTPAYKSPELIKDIEEELESEFDDDLDLNIKVRPQPADIWAAGVIVIEMIVGKNPYLVSNSAHDTEKKIKRYCPFNDEYLMKKIINADQGDLEARTDGKDLKVLLEKMLAKDPKRRIKVGDIKFENWSHDDHRFDANWDQRPLDGALPNYVPDLGRLTTSQVMGETTTKADVEVVEEYVMGGFETDDDDGDELIKMYSEEVSTRLMKQKSQDPPGVKETGPLPEIKLSDSEESDSEPPVGSSDVNIMTSEQFEEEFDMDSDELDELTSPTNESDPAVTQIVPVDDDLPQNISSTPQKKKKLADFSQKRALVTDVPEWFSELSDDDQFYVRMFAIKKYGDLGMEISLANKFNVSEKEALHYIQWWKEQDNQMQLPEITGIWEIASTNEACRVVETENDKCEVIWDATIPRDPIYLEEGKIILKIGKQSHQGMFKKEQGRLEIEWEDGDHWRFIEGNELKNEDGKQCAVLVIDDDLPNNNPPPEETNIEDCEIDDSEELMGLGMEAIFSERVQRIEGEPLTLSDLQGLWFNDYGDKIEVNDSTVRFNDDAKPYFIVDEGECFKLHGFRLLKWSNKIRWHIHISGEDIQTIWSRQRRIGGGIPEKHRQSMPGVYQVETENITITSLQGDWYNDKGEKIVVEENVCKFEKNGRTFKIKENPLQFEVAGYILKKNNSQIVWECRKPKKQIMWMREKVPTFE